MPNQMIALQARSPQLPDPSRRTAQFVNMMNMARQQEAAQRQSALAQQQMTINAAQEERAAALQGPALTKAQQDNILQALEIFREGVADIAEGDIAAAEAVRADLVARVQGWDKVLPPAASWDRNTRYGLMMKADKEIDKTITTPTTETIFGPNDEVLEATRGGLPGVAGVRPLLNMPARGAEAPAATPTAPAPAVSTPSPIPVGEFGETRVAPDGGPLNEFQQDHIRRMKEGLGMTDTPASFTGNGMGAPAAAQMTPEVMSNIVKSAFDTGVMAQVDFDQLLATQPPQNKQALVDSFRRANITLQADAPSLADSAMNQQQSFAGNPVQTPQAEFAVYRGQPREQTLAQTNVVGQQAYGRSASPTSPAPADIGLGRRGAEARVERITPGETRANTLAQEQAKEAAAAAAAPAAAERERNLAFSKERGTADAKFMESAPTVVEASNEGRKILNQMIGDAYVTKQGKIAVPKGGRSPHAGFESVVGLGFPGMRFVPGSQSADFDKKFKQVLGKSFLKAFNDLRGGGSITEIEGVKATEAITRLSRFSSEVEFIRAARELEDILAKGEQRALDRRARIEGKSAPRVSTPTSKKSNPRELRFNPATGGFN